MKLIRNVIVILAAGMLLAACGQPNKTQTEQIIHDYLLAHPEILIDMSQKLQQQQQQKMQDAAVTAITQNFDTIFNNANSVVVGNPKGTVTLVEFFDYQCVHCARMFPLVQALIKANPNLRVVLKEFPIFGPASQYAAQATLAAAAQGKAEQLHDALFESGYIEGKMTNAEVLAMAKKVGLNIPELEKAMNSDAVKNEIKNNFTLAQTLSLQGTPAFIIAPTDKAAATADKITFIPGASDQATLQAGISKA